MVRCHPVLRLDGGAALGLSGAGVPSNASRVGRSLGPGDRSSGKTARVEAVVGDVRLVEMAVDVDSLMGRHERAWERRVEVLERWHEAWAQTEQAGERLESRRRACEAELVRVSQGLTARQRAWAAQHSTFATRPRDRAGRQVVVNWTYRRKQIETAEAKWAATLAAARQTVADADVSLATASRDVLEAWEIQAPSLTGVSCRGLRLLSRRAPMPST
jgi:hypothetical protein